MVGPEWPWVRSWSWRTSRSVVDADASTCLTGQSGRHIAETIKVHRGDMNLRIDVAGPVAAVTTNGLLDAFWRYETALMDNDVDALDDLFLAGDKTIRADHEAVLQGHDAIARFRAARTSGAPARRVVDVHVRELGDDLCVVLAETCRSDGAPGLQSQVWKNTADGWKIAYAHVSAGAPRDSRIWRKVGAPLAAATGTGPLTGLTVAVKDLFALAGERIGGGTPAYLEQAPIEECNAAAVDALLAAGATVTGLAHTDELAYSLGGTNPHYGTPENPAAPGRIPGGSTSGPSVAVSSGQVDVGLGTDTAGSIRVPASYQGLWGLRPTHGAVDTGGLLPLAPSFDTVGVLTRDLTTLTRAADVLLPESEATEIITVVVDSALLAYADPDVRRSFERAVESIGACTPVEERDVLGADYDNVFSAFRTLQAYEAWQTHGSFLTKHPRAVATDVAGRFRDASSVTLTDAGAARRGLNRFRDRLATTLGTGTVLLLPSTSSVAPAAGDGTAERARAATLHLTCLASAAGRPALSMPMLWVGGLPVGLCAVGSPGHDRALPRFGEQIAAILT
ncbi:MAG: DUF3225 domain-containing protein [Gordonia sp. (in: high G+C Gram-positive bacteria)]